MKASDYLNKKYNLLKRGHEHECYCNPCQEFDEFERLIKKLEAKAAKWDDPQTQADLELAQALKWAIEKEIKFVRNTVNFRTSFVDAYDKSKLLSLFREQKRGAE